MAFASIFVPHFMLQAVVRTDSSLCDRALVLIDGIRHRAALSRSTKWPREWESNREWRKRMRCNLRAWKFVRALERKKKSLMRHCSISVGQSLRELKTPPKTRSF